MCNIFKHKSFFYVAREKRFNIFSLNLPTALFEHVAWSIFIFILFYIATIAAASMFEQLRHLWNGSVANAMLIKSKEINKKKK